MVDSADRGRHTGVMDPTEQNKQAGGFRVAYGWSAYTDFSEQDDAMEFAATLAAKPASDPSAVMSASCAQTQVSARSLRCGSPRGISHDPR